MKTTPLHAQHIELGARMAPFAGYEMPIQYTDGVLAEHNWTREHAGLFDVSHMGQLIIEGTGAAAFLETLTPSPLSTLKEGAAKYTVLTNEQGGIIDDLIITRMEENRFFAVINAGCKDKDIEWIQNHLPDDLTLTHLEDSALIALQGPQAARVLEDTLQCDVSDLPYMHMMLTQSPCGKDILVSRLGYTGEDGFELSLPGDVGQRAWTGLLRHDLAKPVGLAARDSLRLEMGYPLYGHDIDATTSPVEADITWIMGKKNHTGFIGAARIFEELRSGPARRRVGIKLTGQGIAREGAEIYAPSSGQKIGELTSGGFSPTLKEAIGQGYIEAASAKTGTKIAVRVRGRDIEGVVAPLPFIPPKTKAAKKQAA
ncbi:MAG: glycine cleavage system aminomethyltransferase GcvT [Rhodospirillales bacterium]|nr:glycine cleavage system aminomethyltransferase GcvT [Alphaproteobacteria bacterium]USO03544.1 MAG: glycine cleavage system aminomethyltransferase GcvT [Rhodospirillales bacterium]